MTDARDPELTGFARDAGELLDGRTAEIRPDFAAMLARARALAAEVEARPSASVIPLAGEASDDDDDDDEARDAGLGAFTAALCGELDGQLHERSLAEIPPAPVPGRRRFGAIVGVLAAAAAVLLLIAGGASLARRVDDGGRGVEANAAGHGEVSGGAARADEVRAAVPVVPVAPVPQDSIEPAAAVTAEVAVEAVPGDSSGPAPRIESPRKRRPTPTPTPAQASLEEEAQALWQRGELAAAEQKLREVLRAADGRRVELAYGDLFALTRQMHGADGQAKVWREYLGRFPRGRFAEDARAGLCQRAGGEARAACWREYLAEHPDGAHRAAAAAAGGAP